MDNSTTDKSIDWLVDSPLFIDKKQIDKLYESIVRPEFELVSISTKDQNSTKNQFSDKTVASGSAAGSIFGVVKAKLSLGKHSSSGSEKAESNESIEAFAPISSPERKLEELAALYQLSENYKYINSELVLGDKSPDWHVQFSKKVPNPKPLCFFELPAGACLIPAAAEFENGKVVPLYAEYGKALTNESGGPVNRYPEPDENLSDDELLEKRKEYWDSYTQRFCATKAMLCIEKACEDNGNIRWIAFRVPVSNSGDTLHLHIVPNEEYFTGTFAYNFVKRFHKHGGKLVGMLKAEPDLNVLAIYEN